MLVGAACAGLVLCMVSCAACRPVSGQGSIALRELSVGDRLQVRLIDGRVIRDTFVLATETRLECKFHAFELNQVQCIGRPLPSGVKTLGTIVLACIAACALLAMASVGGPWV